MENMSGDNNLKGILLYEELDWTILMKKVDE